MGGQQRLHRLGQTQNSIIILIIGQLHAGGCRAGYYDLCLFVKIKHRGNMRSKLSQVGYYNHNVKVWYIFFYELSMIPLPTIPVHGTICS